MAVTRRHVDRFTFLILHALQGKQDVTSWGHHFYAVAEQEFVFHVNFSPAVTPYPGEFADKLLALRQR
ncbi:hypothetical protein D3C76_1293950 [compost metagenome]